MWCIFNEAPVIEGLESQWGGGGGGGSGDKAVGLLLITGLVEVGWHHDWAGGTCTAAQNRGSGGGEKRDEVERGFTRRWAVQQQPGDWSSGGTLDDTSLWKRPLFHILTNHNQKHLVTTLTMVLHAQHNNPESEAAKWNSGFVIFYTQCDICEYLLGKRSVVEEEQIVRV